MGSSSNHPEYPDPNVSNFVSIKLSASNYKLWKTQMRCFIDNVGLLGFIDCTTPSPPSPPPSSSSNGTMVVPNDKYRQWRRLDQRLKGRILESLSEEVLPTVVDFDTASEVWTELQLRFDPFLQPLAQKKENSEHEAAEEDIDTICREMYRAAVTGDLYRANSILNSCSNARATRIASGSQTALHVAVGTKNTNHFVKKFVESMTKDQLELQTTEGNTSLSVAAMVGNKEAAEILVVKHPSLLYIENCNHSLPMHMAAKYGHENTLWYLLTATEDELGSDLHNNPIEGQSGVQLLVDVITSGFIGIALYLVQRYPRLAILKTEEGDSPLAAIARKPSAFQSGNQYHFSEKIISSRYPQPLGPFTYKDSFTIGQRNVGVLRSEVAKGRGNKNSAEWVHSQACALVKRLCTRIRCFTNRHSFRLQWEKPILVAASLGTHAVVEEVVHKFLNEIWSNNEDRNWIFQLAVEYRCTNVFNLIRQMRHMYAFSVPTDASGNNILHMAAKLGPSHTLNHFSGAALQMRFELQWFQEVQMFANPCCKDEENSSKETPQMVFSREHNELLVEAKTWMKDTANSCTIAASLIASVVFAAAITVPGGNSGNNGLPIFSERKVFKIFYLSNAASLSLSVTSLLIFLSILTGRCAEKDFLVVLPRKLLFGLLTLFYSIATMMISFSTILYLVFGPRNASFYVILILVPCLPVFTFTRLQTPLVVDLYLRFISFAHSLY